MVMSCPDIPAFRISRAAAASPPNPPPTMCALMDFLPGLDGAIAPVLSYKQMSQVVSLPKNRHARVYSSNRGFKVIAHVSIGVKDVERSKRFYDQALQPLGYRMIRRARSGAGYGYGADIIFFWVMA